MGGGRYPSESWRSSELEKIRNGDEHHSDRDQCNDIGNKVGVDHQHQTAHQGNDGTLLLAVQEKTEPDRAEQQPPEQYPDIHYLVSLATSQVTNSITSSLLPADCG